MSSKRPNGAAPSQTCPLGGEEEVTEERKSHLSHDSFPSPACLVQAHFPHAFEVPSAPLQAAAAGPARDVGVAAVVGAATMGGKPSPDSSQRPPLLLAGDGCR